MFTSGILAPSVSGLVAQVSGVCEPIQLSEYELDNWKRIDFRLPQFSLLWSGNELAGEEND